MHNFKNLKIWQAAIELVKKIYRITKTFPKEEQFGLISQINRCAVSIPSNIAEGSGQSTNKSFIRFISISMGSSFELETQLIIARDLKYLNEHTFTEISQELQIIQKQLLRFKQYLQTQQ